MRNLLKTFIYVAVILLVGVAILSFFVLRNLSKNSPFQTNLIIEIKKGDNIQTTAGNLISNGALTASNRQLYVYASRYFNKKITPGFYEVEAGSSVIDIINLIDSGKTKTVKVTFPEGWRLEQIAARLNAEKILAYDDFIEEASAYEGRLFPDTYYFNPRMTAAEVLTMMLDDYNKRVSGFTVTNDDLVLASIVEREASKDSERGTIAGIYQNRINRSMRLEADPTVQYAKDTNALKLYLPEKKTEYKFWQPIGFSDYKSVNSEFNTYLNIGLPPAPICNPGLASIRAALDPEKHAYIYFLQHDGQMYPSKTLAEHDNYRRTILGQK